MLPCNEQTPTEILVSKEVEGSPLKRKKSSRNKPDGGERKKRSKQSKERKKSEGNDGGEKIASRDEGSRSASKKRNKRSIPVL